MVSTTPAIAVDCRSFTYAEAQTPVLKDTSFTVDYGKLTLLFGRSGCGKSTLLQLMNGIIPRIVAGTLEGEVKIAGSPLQGQSLSAISRRVGSVLQNVEAQIVHQRVEDELAFGCENFGMAPAEIGQRVSRLCKEMKLETTWKTRTLSVGQKQRVVTGSTLATDPEILMLDEPLANLDRQGAELLLNQLRQLAQKGKAVLLIEHRLDMVLPYVDIVWQMENGRLSRVEDKQTCLQTQIGQIADAVPHRPANASPALRCEKVTKQFDGRYILNELDLTVFQGERLLLLGENGGGKSTLFQLLSRLQQPDAGKIAAAFAPELGKKPSRAWFRRVGIVYQNPNYQLFMPSVEEELCFGAVSRAYAIELAERFSLTGLLSHHPQALSEGQKRRVTIAAILAQKPQLLLLDEPTVGQDYEGLKQLIRVLNEIHSEEENTMLTITHDFRCAQALCDRAVWLENGAVKQEGGKELVTAFFQRNIRKNEQGGRQ